MLRSRDDMQRRYGNNDPRGCSREIAMHDDREGSGRGHDIKSDAASDLVSGHGGADDKLPEGLKRKRKGPYSPVSGRSNEKKKQ